MIQIVAICGITKGMEFMEGHITLIKNLINIERFVIGELLGNPQIQNMKVVMSHLQQMTCQHLALQAGVIGLVQNHQKVNSGVASILVIKQIVIVIKQVSV